MQSVEKFRFVQCCSGQIQEYAESIVQRVRQPNTKFPHNLWLKGQVLESA